MAARTASLQRSAAAGEILGAFDGTRLIGTARYLPMRQWWRGRSLPMAGVAGVKVAPEERGRGVGRLLMVRLIADMAGNGYPLSALYPATAPLYRSLGWEFAGGKYETTLPVTALATMIGPDPAAAADATAGDASVSSGPDAALAGGARGQRGGGDDAGPGLRGPRRLGQATHEPDLVAEWLDDHDHFAYLAADGFLSYRWADGTDSIRAEIVAAASAPIQYRYPGDDYKDLMAGVDAVIAKGYVDAERTGVTGGSGGGILTNWTITQTSRFKAAVAQRSIADWADFWYTADFTLFTPTWFRGAPWQEEAISKRVHPSLM